MPYQQSAEKKASKDIIKVDKCDQHLNIVDYFVFTLIICFLFVIRLQCDCSEHPVVSLSVFLDLQLNETVLQGTSQRSFPCAATCMCINCYRINLRHFNESSLGSIYIETCSFFEKEECVCLYV